MQTGTENVHCTHSCKGLVVYTVSCWVFKLFTILKQAKKACKNLEDRINIRKKRLQYQNYMFLFPPKKSSVIVLSCCHVLLIKVKKVFVHECLQWPSLFRHIHICDVSIIIIYFKKKNPYPLHFFCTYIFIERPTFK